MGKMYLVLDAGNTNVVAGVYRDRQLVGSWRFRTDAQRTEDEWYSLLSSVLQANSIDIQEAAFCVISSVVPDITRTLTHLCEKYLHCESLSVNGYTDLGLTYNIPDPGHVGADLITDAYAAWQKYHCPTIVCDLGTATTLQLIGADGFFHGTIIAPGLLTSFNTLVSRAALLSRVELDTPTHLLGNTTRDSILTGTLTGHAAMLDGLIERIRSEYSRLGSMTAIITGGIAPLVHPLSRQIDVLDRTLLLDGLALIAHKFAHD